MAFTLVASVGTGGTSTGVTSSAIDTTGATLLVVSVSWAGATSAITVSDSKGNTWTPGTLHNLGTNIYHQFFYCCLNPAVGTGHTMSATIGGSNFWPSMVVHAFSGGLVLWAATESGATVSGAGPLTPGSLTPGANGALVITGFAGNSSNATAVTGGFTLTGAIGSGVTSAAQAYLIQSTAAAANPSWSWAASTQVAVSQAVFVLAPSPLIAYTASTPANTGGTTPAMTTTGAGLLVFDVGYYGGTSVVVSVSDSKGNTWVALTAQANGTQASNRLFYVRNPTVGTGHTFTVSAGGSTFYPNIIVYAFSGTTNVLDLENGGSATSGAGSVAAGSIVPSVNGALVVTGMSPSDGVPGAVTPTTLSPSRTQQGSVVGAYLLQGTAAAISPSWSWTGGTQGAAATVAAFKPPVSAPARTTTDIWMPL